MVSVRSKRWFHRHRLVQLHNQRRQRRQRHGHGERRGPSDPSELVYTGTDDPIKIGHLKTVASTVLATDNGSIDALNVGINLARDSVTDLTVLLVDPTSVSLDLASPIQSGDVTYGV